MDKETSLRSKKASILLAFAYLVAGLVLYGIASFITSGQNKTDAAQVRIIPAFIDNTPSQYY